MRGTYCWVEIDMAVWSFTIRWELKCRDQSLREGHQIGRGGGALVKSMGSKYILSMLKYIGRASCDCCIKRVVERRTQLCRWVVVTHFAAVHKESAGRTDLS